MATPEEGMFKLIVPAVLLFTAATAAAQPGWRRGERNAQAVETDRSARRLGDDMRDLQRFEMTLQAFDAAMARRDPIGVRQALQSFVQQGRIEVGEQRRETMQAMGEAQRSRNEAWRDRNPRDRYDARDDRRDARNERVELIQEEAALAELERAAAAEVNFGPRFGVLQAARSAMVRFVQLARVEVRRSHQELREDRRELREDQRAVRRRPY
jgi:hypothetical protein